MDGGFRDGAGTVIGAFVVAAGVGMVRIVGIIGIVAVSEMLVGVGWLDC